MIQDIRFLLDADEFLDGAEEIDVYTTTVVIGNLQQGDCVALFQINDDGTVSQTEFCDRVDGEKEKTLRVRSPDYQKEVPISVRVRGPARAPFEMDSTLKPPQEAIKIRAP